MRIGSLNLRAYEGEEAWKPISGLSNPSQFVKIESAVKSPLLTDVQGNANLWSCLFHGFEPRFNPFTTVFVLTKI